MYKIKEIIKEVDKNVLFPIDEKTGLLVKQLPVDQIAAQSFNIDEHNNIMNDVSAYFAATDEMEKRQIAQKLEMVLPNTDVNNGKSVRQILDEIPSSRAQHFSEIFAQSEYFAKIAEKYNTKSETSLSETPPATQESKSDTQILNEV